jgi:ribulose-5-phosphate 4-epimerase/fuculose-1-phosphate aldolase
MADYEAFKEQVLQTARWLNDHGFFGGRLGSGGNVSLMLRDQGLMVITPSRKPYRTLSLADICVVDTGLRPVDGKLPPSMEAGMHAAVYRERKDACAIVHTHQHFASVFSLINRPIPALFDEITLEIGPEVAVVPYAFSGSPELTAHMTEALNNGCMCFILQNHGAVCLGSDLETAMRNAEALEKVARVYYYALCTGLNISTLPDAAVQHWQRLRMP